MDSEADLAIMGHKATRLKTKANKLKVLEQKPIIFDSDVIVKQLDQTVLSALEIFFFHLLFVILYYKILQCNINTMGKLSFLSHSI